MQLIHNVFFRGTIGSFVLAFCYRKPSAAMPVHALICVTSEKLNPVRTQLRDLQGALKGQQGVQLAVQIITILQDA